MKRAGRVKRTIALLGIFVLVGKVLVAAYVPASAAAGTTIVDPVLGILSICEPGGHETPGGGSAPASNANHCTACTLLTGLALALALAFAFIVFPPPAVRLHRAPSVRTLADHLSLGGIRSRAPPLAA
jgi:hypothetical protein